MNKSLLLNAGVGTLCLLVGFFVNHLFTNHVTPPDITIDIVGKTNYDLGDIAEFDAKISNAPNNLESSIAWKVISNNKTVDLKNLSPTQIIFPVGIKPTKMTLLAHGVYIDPKTKKLKSSDFFVKDVTVGGINPPGPDPTPTPDPQPTDGKFKIAILSYNSAKTLVSSSNIVNAAKALIKGFTKTSDEIGQNKYATLKDVYAGLKNNNDDELNKAGENLTNWDKWEAALQKRIGELQRGNQLPSLTDHADLFKEIANGLSYVK